LGGTQEGIMNIGAQLRHSREAKGLTLDALAHTTRVQPRILAAIERNDVSAVPPRPFGRGFVRAYAREIGLDPEQTARDYFAQFAPVTETPAGSPSRPASREPLISTRGLTWTAVGALAVAIVLGLASRVTAPDVTQRQTAGPIVGTSGAGAAVAASDTRAATQVADVKTPALTKPLSSHALTVVLKTTGRCWVTASADGRRVIYQLLPAGAVETLSADRDITILVGDGGAITWTVNRREVGNIGARGEMRTVRVTPDTAATVR
jgi:cytoskeleton protein RodZ